MKGDLEPAMELSSVSALEDSLNQAGINRSATDVIRLIWSSIKGWNDNGIPTEHAIKNNNTQLRICAHWSRSLAMLEREIAQKVISSTGSRDLVDLPSLLSIEEYLPFEKEFSAGGTFVFSSCKNAIFVGCGAYPETLLKAIVSNLSGAGLVVGLDASPEATKLAMNVYLKIVDARPSQPSPQAKFLDFDGKLFDYNGFDFIFISNGVRDKQMILNAAQATAPAGANLGIRLPRNSGVLLYEGVQNLTGWVIVSAVVTGPASTTLFLKKKS